MPKKKSVKKIIKQKQKQSTKINITIDNSKKTTRRNNQQNPPNKNRYDSMPTYNILYDNPKPPPPLMQSNKEENTNPLTKSVGSQTSINKKSFETQTEPEPERYPIDTQTTEPERHPIDTQTESEPQRQTAETQTPKRIKIKISKINFTTPTQENNLMSQVNFDEAISLNRIYDNLPERRTMTQQPFDELNTTPSVKEKVKIINERLKQISVNKNPLESKKPVGRPKKKEGDPKGTYNRKKL